MKSQANRAPTRIALDGPSASGKSTIGSMLADRLGCDFLDTGMMYRAVTLLARRSDISSDDVDTLGELATKTRFSAHLRDDGDWRLMADGEDVTDALYKDEINKHVSPVSAVSVVRRALVRQQRAIAAARPIVMAGRDIGTVVLKDAPIKIYLDASAETRAARRVRDVYGNANGQGFEDVLRSITRRDEIDSNRADSPLRPAADAIIIATDDLTPTEVVETIIEFINERDWIDGAETLTSGAVR